MTEKEAYEVLVCILERLELDADKEDAMTALETLTKGRTK